MKCLFLVTNAASNTSCLSNCFSKSHFFTSIRFVFLTTPVKQMDSPGQSSAYILLRAQRQEAWHGSVCCATDSFNPKKRQNAKPKTPLLKTTPSTNHPFHHHLSTRLTRSTLTVIARQSTPLSEDNQHGMMPNQHKKRRQIESTFSTTLLVFTISTTFLFLFFVFLL